MKHEVEGREDVGDIARTAPRRAWAFPAEPYLLVGFVVGLTLLARLFPFSGDDWAWGSSIGLDRLELRFAGYNGRWSGNLAVLFLTRSGWLAPLIVSVTLCSIVVLMTRISGMRNLAGYGTALAMLMLMPLGTWRQTVVWLSGFSNYALSTVGLLIFVWVTQRAWLRRDFGRPWLVAALTLPFAVVCAMFVEHVTVALVLFSVLALVLVLLTRRQWPVQAAWAVGSITGAVIMFSNTAYRSIARGTSSYQRVDDTGIRAIADHALGGVSQLSVAANVGLNTCLLAALAALAWQAHQRAGRLARRGLVSVVAAGAGTAVGAGVTAVTPAGDQWAWLSSIGMLIALVLGAIFLVADPQRRTSVLAMLALVAVLIAPAAVMRPYGPRNFLPTYVLLTVVLLILVREFMGVRARSEVRAVVAALGLGTAAVVFSSYYAIYTQIDRADERRLDTIRTAVAEGRQRVSVPKLPYPEYVHQGDPVNRIFLARFKLFHGVPDTVRLRFTQDQPNSARGTVPRRTR